NPIEVEEAIQKIPSIKEVVVIGVPDEEWGQKVTAIVTLANGAVPDLQEIRTFLKAELTDFKIPKELKVVDELPKTITGKVKRKELQEQFSKAG
ncbi:MAG: hypothetical protein MI700_13400, partial [Balneolales bacterium]|nr:hypothetical protein [Balneolales bacterium]